MENEKRSFANIPPEDFERAVEAVVAGNFDVLKAFLKQYPAIVMARSEREHHATLLHYVAANGVEDDRQKTPTNAVAIAALLLEAGSEVDALAYMYGGLHTTMSMLVSSCHPAQAGVQIDLINILIDFGAEVEGAGSGNWVSPLMTALAFGYLAGAETLVLRGAKVTHVAAAAGLGLLEETKLLLNSASNVDRHRALALASQMGHTQIVSLLLDAGENPNRYNPEGNHSHSTPLHQAAIEGHLEVVMLLVQRGAKIDMKDKMWGDTPLGWAIYAKKKEVADYLRGLTGADLN